LENISGGKERRKAGGKEEGEGKTHHATGTELSSQRISQQQKQ
jgi:hypothetical protein